MYIILWNWIVVNIFCYFHIVISGLSLSVSFVNGKGVSKLGKGNNSRSRTISILVISLAIVILSNIIKKKFFHSLTWTTRAHKKVFCLFVCLFKPLRTIFLIFILKLTRNDEKKILAVFFIIWVNLNFIFNQPKYCKCSRLSVIFSPSFYLVIKFIGKR